MNRTKIVLCSNVVGFCKNRRSSSRHTHKTRNCELQLLKVKLWATLNVCRSLYRNINKENERLRRSIGASSKSGLSKELKTKRPLWNCKLRQQTKRNATRTCTKSGETHIQSLQTGFCILQLSRSVLITTRPILR